MGGCRDDVAASAITFRALDQNWSFIWPWMVAITKGILKNPAPSAPSGLENARKFVDVSAILLVYPIYNPTRQHNAFEAANALVRLNQSHPNILILMTNIWLRASKLGLGDDVVGSLMHGIGLSLEALTESGGEGARLLEGSSRDELEAFLTTTSFDLMGTLLKGFMLEASRPSPDINILSMSLTLDILRHVDLTRRDVIPVISLAFKTLTRRHFQPFDPQKQSSYAKYLCLVESLQLLTYTIITNMYQAIPLLEEGLLVHIFQLRGVVIEHVHHVLAHPGIRNPAFTTTCLFSILGQRSIHRPLMVRLVNSMRKVRKLALDNWDHPLFGPNAILYSWRERWDNLREATFRHESISAKFMSKAHLLCGNHEVSAAKCSQSDRATHAQSKSKICRSARIPRYILSRPIYVVGGAWRTFTALEGVKKLLGEHITSQGARSLK
ncbi:hypothetical protein PM082_021335 [Marasmius tenuissimus]|nr:hypothetical protein PM082_021335 [Marasmius tenuissimus]